MKRLIESAKAFYEAFLKKTKIRGMVREYRMKTKAPFWLYPQMADERRIRLCARQVTANAFETLAALYGDNGAFLAHRTAIEELIEKIPPQANLPLVIECLGGLDYMTEYTRQDFGVDGLPVLEAIHEARMQEPMTRPKIEDVLIKQGWMPAAFDQPGSDT